MIKKRGNRDLCSPIGMIPSCKEVEILGATFQCDSKSFSINKDVNYISHQPSIVLLKLNSNHDALFKYADDSTIIAPVWKEVDYSDQLVSQSLNWTNTN
ncbi:unnamed protein product [Porites evermanni]|uniref:Uncharacterized protein n=1 Tax=Porites evermanni TaxID=104178 RepID=A0ABN8Q1Q1_9CNID|nr:unnamed protein product [Porites evermanni]